MSECIAKRSATANDEEEPRPEPAGKSDAVKICTGSSKFSNSSDARTISFFIAFR